MEARILYNLLAEYVDGELKKNPSKEFKDDDLFNYLFELIETEEVLIDPFDRTSGIIISDLELTENEKKQLIAKVVSAFDFF